MSSTSLWSDVKKNLLTTSKSLSLLAGALGVLFLAGCDSPQPTIDKLHKEIVAFQTTPDDKKQLEIEQDLAKLETQVEKLQKKGDAKAEQYASELTSLRTAYQTAKMNKALEDAKKALEGLGNAFKDGVKSLGNAFSQGTNSTNQ